MATITIFNTLLDVLCCKAAVMMTPSIQSSPTTVLSPKRGSPGEVKGAVCFQGCSISQLPAEVLLSITSYLSMREVLVFSQVCRELRNKLEEQK